jgi:hypothetical protein
MIMVSGNWIRGGVGLQLLEAPPESKEVFCERVWATFGRRSPDEL